MIRSKRLPTPTETELVELAVTMVVAMQMNRKYWKGRSREEAADWAIEQLAKMGYETLPMGMCWAKLSAVNETRG